MSISQRKFTLAIIALVGGLVCVAVERMGGGEFVALVTSVLGLYGAANVAEKHVTKESS